MVDVERNFSDAWTEYNQQHSGDLATFTSREELYYLTSLKG